MTVATADTKTTPWANTPYFSVRRIVLRNDGQFGVVFKDPDTSTFREILAQVKDIPGAQFEAASKSWTVPATPHAVQKFLTFLKTHGFKVPPDAMAKLQEHAGRVEDVRKNIVGSHAMDAEIDVKGLGGELRHFQRAGVAYAVRNKRVMIADDMGTGKTIQALATCQAMAAFPAVVVCPASLKINWYREAVKWLPGKRSLMLSGKPGPEMVYCLDRLFSLYAKVRDKRYQSGDDVHASRNLKSELSFLRNNSWVFEDPDILRSSETDEPIDETLVGIIDSDHPSLPSRGGNTGARDASFSVDNSSEISKLKRISGHDHGAGPNTPGNMKAASADERREAPIADAILLRQLLVRLPEFNSLRYADKLFLRQLLQVAQREFLLIVNYDILAFWCGVLRLCSPKAVIFDESHYLKSRKAKRTSAAKELTLNVDVRLCLSGTPILNRPEELVTQLELLGRMEEFGGWWKFVRRYCAAHRGRFGMDTSGARNLEELNERLRATCFIRRRKADVLKELPPKQRSIVPLEIDNRPEYQKAEQDLIRWLREQATEKEGDLLLSAAERAAKTESDIARKMQAEQLVRIQALKRLSARGKLDGVTEWVNDFLESGEKLVLFAHHVEIVEELGRRFKAPIITGGTDLTARQSAVDKFQRDPACKVIVLNMQAGGVGLTLTASSNVAFVELGWTPGGMDQAEDRCHRIGQEDAVTAWYLIGEKTIDEDIYSLIEAKRVVVSAATDGGAPEGEGSIMGDLIKTFREK